MSDFTADYLAARIDAERAVGITAQAKADAVARRIWTKADRAGATIPAGIDDAARVEVHGLAAGEKRNGITGYDHCTGAPTFA